MKASEISFAGINKRDSKEAHKDMVICLLLALLVLATRLPFRTQFLFNWDSVNFAFGIQQYDVTQHAPHPPGYFYYVGLAKIINSWLSDANASLILEGILFSAGAVVVLYFLGTTLFNRPTGVVASLLLTVSVTYWSLGEVALSYVTLAFFSSLVALLAHKTTFEKRNLLPILALVYSSAGGFRAELLLFLAPLFVISLYNQPWRRVLLSLLIAIMGFLLWFAPTVWLSGGLSGYWAVFSAYTQSDVLQRYSILYNGWRALAWSLKDLANYSFYSLYATSVLLAAAIPILVIKRRSWRDQRVLLIATWIAPILLFYTFVHIGDPGYVFSFIPGILLIAGAVWSTTRQATPSGHMGRWLVTAVLVLVLVANSAIFVFSPRLLTAPGLRQNDSSLSAKIDYLKSNYSPDSTALISYALYKHFLYYLPQYKATYWLDAHYPKPTEIALPSTVENLLLLDNEVNKMLDSSIQKEETFLQGGAIVYRIPVQRGAKLIYNGSLITIK